MFLILLDGAPLSCRDLMISNSWGSRWGQLGRIHCGVPSCFYIPFPLLTLCAPAMETTESWLRDQSLGRECLWSGFAFKQPGADLRLLVVGSPLLTPSVPSLGKAACRDHSPEFLMNQRTGQKPQVMVEDAGDSAGKRLGMGDSC